MKRSRPEDALQRSIISHLEQRPAHGLVWWACPNGGERSKIEAAIMNGLGVKAGAADLMFLYRGHFYCLELKAAGKKPTPEQYAFLDAVNAACGFAYWTDNLDKAIGWLETHGLLRGRADLRSSVAAAQEVAA